MASLFCLGFLDVFEREEMDKVLTFLPAEYASAQAGWSFCASRSAAEIPHCGDKRTKSKIEVRLPDNQRDKVTGKDI